MMKKTKIGLFSAALVGMLAFSMSSCKTIEKVRAEDEALLNTLDSQIQSLRKENNELKNLVKQDQQTLENMRKNY